MGGVRRTDRARSDATVPVDYQALCRKAGSYLDAAAWQRAFDLLWPPLAACWPPETESENVIEAVALLLSAAVRTGRHDLLEAGAAYLRRRVASLRNHPRIRSLALLMLAHAALHAGDARDARRRLEEIERLGAQTPLADSILVRGALLRSRLEISGGACEAAESWGLLAVERAAAAGSEGHRGDAYALLAILARQRGALGEANALYARAQEAYWRAGALSGLLIVRLNRAWCLGLLGLHGDAGRLFREVLEGAHREERAATALRANLGLGWLAVRAGRLDEARRRLLRVWRAARQLAMPREQILALAYLTETAVLAGRLVPAALALRRARHTAERLPRGGDLDCELDLRAALLAIAQEHPQDALELARRALRVARNGSLTWETAQGWRLMGLAYYRRRQRRAARRAFERAEGLYRGMGEQIEGACVRAWQESIDSAAGHRSRGMHQGMGGEEISGARRFWLEHPLLGPWGGSAAGERYPRVREQIAGTGPTPATAPAHTIPDGPGTPARSIPDGPGTPARSIPDGPGTPARSIPEAVSTADERLSPVWHELGLRSQSPEMITALRLAETYAPGALPALVLGETGTGKDLIAQGLHRLSGRTGAYVPVNCASAQRDLFLAELFGARRGAYTGATEDRRGLVEAARDGTLFLDEVGDLDADAQGYLLRFLDTGEVRPLGAERSHHVKTRVIAATCRDLRRLQEEGRFRTDLYARLAALVIQLPALRQRPGDLVELLPMLWDRAGGDRAGYEAIFDRAVLSRLSEYVWPGNVRELSQLVERAHLFFRQCDARAAREHLLAGDSSPGLPPGSFQARPAQSAPRSQMGLPAHTAPRSQMGLPAQPAPPSQTGLPAQPAPPGQPVHPGQSVQSGASPVQGRWAEQTLERALKDAGGRVAGAARLLGISRSHAYRLYKGRRLDRSA